MNPYLLCLSRTVCTELGESVFIGSDSSCRLSTNQRIGVFTGLTGTTTILKAADIALLCYLSLRASEVLHNRMVMAILRAPARFFDVNSAGEYVSLSLS